MGRLGFIFSTSKSAGFSASSSRDLKCYLPSDREKRPLNSNHPFLLPSVTVPAPPGADPVANELTNQVCSTRQRRLQALPQKQPSLGGSDKTFCTHPFKGLWDFWSAWEVRDANHVVSGAILFSVFNCGGPCFYFFFCSGTVAFQEVQRHFQLAV